MLGLRKVFWEKTTYNIWATLFWRIFVFVFLYIRAVTNFVKRRPLYLISYVLYIELRDIKPKSMYENLLNQLLHIWLDLWKINILLIYIYIRYFYLQVQCNECRQLNKNQQKFPLNCMFDRQKMLAYLLDWFKFMSYYGVIGVHLIYIFHDMSIQHCQG